MAMLLGYVAQDWPALQYAATESWHVTSRQPRNAVSWHSNACVDSCWVQDDAYGHSLDRKHQRICEAKVTQIEQDACGHADQQVAPCCFTDSICRRIVFWRKRVLRTRDSVLTLALIASSFVRLWLRTLCAGGQHRVQGDRFSTRRR